LGWVLATFPGDSSANLYAWRNEDNW
jgi:hypothetical protein